MRDDRAASGIPAEILAVWLLFLGMCVAIFATYARVPADRLYHVSGSGLEGGASRVLVFSNFPTALVAIAVCALLADRFARTWATVLAASGVVLCAAVFWPGVVDQADLDARPVNAIAALGVVVAAALTVAGVATLGPGTWAARLRGDAARIVIAALALVLAAPWIAADLGVSFEGVPGLGTLYQTGELRSQPGEPTLHPAVHAGHHHGMDGVLLVLSVLLLSRVLPSVRGGLVRGAVGAYLALMLVYGLSEIANDFWLEQVVKRGWTDREIPDVTVPKLSVAWVVVVLGAAVVFALAGRRARSSARVT